MRTLLQYFNERPTTETQAFLDDVNEHGNTGLHWAALGGHLDTVKWLVEHGASPALANEQNYVPLDLANFNDKTTVSDYFLSFLPRLESKGEEGGVNSGMEEAEVVSGDEDKPNGKGVEATKS